MDLCCLIDSEERLSATDLVTMLGDLLERGMCRISRSPPSTAL
jgi:terminal uridylyltransferase